jgi:hypothetical protein
MCGYTTLTATLTPTLTTTPTSPTSHHPLPTTQVTGTINDAALAYKQAFCRWEGGCRGWWV